MIKIPDMSNLLQQEVTRQEFLQCVGVMALALFGVTHLFESLNKGLKHPALKGVEASGYGASTYGR